MKEKEKEISTKEVQTSSDSDLTFTDVQFKLLVLQLQYMRSILRKNKTNSCVTPHDSENNHQSSTNDIDNQNKETQTGISLLCEPESSHGADTQQTAKLRNYTKSLMKDDGMSLLSNANFQENELPYRNAPSSVFKESQQHYHLKFDDVPFILGASSSASHNVVANVQNIIAMMKTHNKVLCGPRFHSRNTTSASTSKNCSQDSNKMLKKLSEELAELQVKQEKLKERFDTAQSGSHFSVSKVNTASAISSSQMVKNDIKKTEVCNHKKEGTSNTSSRSNCKFKNREIKQEKHAVPSNRIQENQSQVSRQRLLRSLQDFKTHLTEEDITWD